jgi:tetratricopeptide (TPR) repeat protein
MNSAAAGYYVTGGTVRGDASCYVPRRADRDLYEGLTRGEFCYVLTSRQMGKSSLMVRTADRLRAEGVTAVVLDLTALGQNVSPEQWYDGLLVHMGQQLALEDELERCWLAHDHLGPLQRWMQAVRQVVLARRPGPVVVFVDEIDAVRSLPFSTDEFFAAIRECYNRRPEDAELRRLTFCLLGVATPSDLIRDVRTTPFNIGRRVELDDFNEQEAAPLLRGLGRDERAAAVLLRRVLHWTGGHPYLTQRLCQAVALDGGVRDAAGVDRVCEAVYLAQRARERDDNLLFVRDRLLRGGDRAGVLDLYARVWRGRRVGDQELDPLVGVLRLSGVTRTVGGCLRVRNRIYRRVFDRAWVRTNMPGAELRRQRSAYRRGAVGATAACLVVTLALWVWWVWYQAPRSAARRETELADEARVRGDPIEALVHYENARQAYSALLAGYLPKPDRLTLQLGEAQAQTWRGVLLESERQPVKAVAALTDARDLLEGLPEADRGRRECRLLLAEVYHNLGIRFDDERKPKKALENYDKGLQLRLELKNEMEDQPGYRRDLARSYGYIGDTQVDLGQMDEARKSYARAERLRADLVAENPADPDALCLHAHDYWNLGYLNDSIGQVDEAVKQYRKGLDVYKQLPPPFDQRLPGDYLTERANMRISVVDFELDRPEPAADVLSLLDLAEAEYRRCCGDTPVDDASRALKRGLARVAVARGKYHFLRKELTPATEALESADKLLTQLGDEKGYNDLYRLALVYALQHQLNPRRRLGGEILALDRLHEAYRNGFNDLRKLKRDRGFDRLRQNQPKEFQEIVAELEKRRG